MGRTAKGTAKKTAKKTASGSKKTTSGASKRLAKKKAARPKSDSGPGDLTKRAQLIVKALAKEYPDSKCALDYRNAYELLMATILSAQCTDVRVNKVTPVLFEKYPTPADLAEAETGELETIIKSTGFFRQKAKSLVACCQDIVERFGGVLPQTMDELTTLAGVGRKTANVILGNVFEIPGVVVDTHVKRLSNRLGLTQQSDPNKIEKDLMELIPEKEWTLFSLRLIDHGRQVCDARKPQCLECMLRKDCPFPEK